LAFDLRNHGDSPWAQTMSYREMVEDLRTSLRSRGVGQAAVVGHSMGGKVAMLAALLHPAEIDRLVIVDIAPAPNPPTLLTYVRAMRAADLRGVTRRGPVEQQLMAAVRDPAERAFLLQNLIIDESGARWRLNLEAIEDEFSEITGFPQLPDDVAYERPTLLVAGARSNYIQPEHQPLIRRLFPQARLCRIDGAGHWVHAEQPAAFLRAAEPFLAGAV
jgi:esterase